MATGSRDKNKLDMSGFSRSVGPITIPKGNIGPFFDPAHQAKIMQWILLWTGVFPKTQGTEISV